MKHIANLYRGCLHLLALPRYSCACNFKREWACEVSCACTLVVTHILILQHSFRIEACFNIFVKWLVGLVGE